MQISVLRWHCTVIYVMKNQCILGPFIIYVILEIFKLTRAIEHKQHFLRWEQSNWGVAKSFCPSHHKELYFIFSFFQTNFNTTPTPVLYNKPKRIAECNTIKDLFLCFFSTLGKSCSNSIKNAKNLNSYTKYFIKLIVHYFNFQS